MGPLVLLDHGCFRHLCPDPAKAHHSRQGEGGKGKGRMEAGRAQESGISLYVHDRILNTVSPGRPLCCHIYSGLGPGDH